MTQPNPQGEQSAPPPDSVDGGLPDVFAAQFAKEMLGMSDAKPAEVAVEAFDQYAADLAERLSSIDTSGRATLLTNRWYDWDQAQMRGGGFEQQAPEKFNEVDLQEFAKAGNGWKFHINFDTENPEITHRVSSFLKALETHDVVSTFKIGENSGQGGKDATVYVGHRDKANAVAPEIENVLGPVLWTQEQTTEHLARTAETEEDAVNDGALDDIPFTEHVQGRFQINDPEFHQYGVQGHPLLKETFGQFLIPPLNRVDEPGIIEQREQIIKDAAPGAEQILVERYGNFYTGSVA